jgi:hypothetical protein
MEKKQETLKLISQSIQSIGEARRNLTEKKEKAADIELGKIMSQLRGVKFALESM